jgi:hypothetical protein
MTVTLRSQTCGLSYMCGYLYPCRLKRTLYIYFADRPVKPNLDFMSGQSQDR